MRTLAVLSILLLLFAFTAGCGGEEEMTAANPGADPSDADKKDPEKKKAPRMSPEAVNAATDFNMVKKMREPDTQKTKALERAKQYAFAPADAQLYVGELLRLAKDHSAAAAAYVKFVSGCPDSKNLNTGRYYAGVCFAESGDLTNAQKYLDQLVANAPDSVVMIRDLGTRIGGAYCAKGQPEKAIPHFMAAADKGSSYAAEELMSAQWLAGDFDGARATALKLITMAEGKEKATARAKVFQERAMLMGKPAKKIDAEGFTIQDFSVDQLKGKVHLVYFWKMPQRGNALKTTKLMSKIYDEFGDKGLMIVGLSKHYGYDPSEHNLGTGRDLTWEEEVKALDVWAVQTDSGYNVRWPFGVTADESNQAPYGFYPAQAIPGMAVVDKKGNLRYFRQGFDATGIELLKLSIKNCLAE